MAEREKVIRGLECCIISDPDDSRECKKCPYRRKGITNEPCFNALHADALVLLKEQEPRVMEFSEIASFDGVVYLEDIDKAGVIRAICNGYIVTCDLLSFSTKRGAPVGSIEDYNKRWRAWTSRPDEEQRKAVAWNG